MRKSFEEWVEWSKENDPAFYYNYLSKLERRLKMSNVHDRRRVHLEDLLKREYIPLFEGRPLRDEIISIDDIMNLEIALNTSKSLEEFLAGV